jgi:hypothetical protein
VITGLVQGQPKRIITQSARAIAADEEQGDEDTELDSDDSELYDDSEYSDSD